MTAIKLINQELGKAWDYAKRVGQRIEGLEKRVRDAARPRVVTGRVTPFFAEKTITFEALEDVPKHATLVVSSQRTTYLTGLTYAVSWSDVTGPSLRARPKALFYERTASQVELFDFEWNMELGATQRRYGTGRAVRGWLSRSSLGVVDNRSCLLFDDKHPLVVKSGDSLTLHVKPTLYNLDPDRGYASTDLFHVRLTAVGYRVFGGDS